MVWMKRRTVGRRLDIASTAVHRFWLRPHIMYAAMWPTLVGLVASCSRALVVLVASCSCALVVLEAEKI